MRIKALLLTASIMSTGTLLATCGLTDVRNTVVAGSLSGVQSVAASWISALFPPAPAVWPG
jgi:hypothetical protein